MKPHEEEFYDFNSVSATECTGLIPSAPENEYEYEAYLDIMTFSPEEIAEEAKHKA